MFARPAEIVEDLWLIADAYSLKMPHWQHNINFLTTFFFFSPETTVSGHGLLYDDQLCSIFPCCAEWIGFEDLDR